MLKAIIYFLGTHSESVVVQSLSHVLLFATMWTAAWQASLSFTISWSLLKFMSIELVMLSSHVILSDSESENLLKFFPISVLQTCKGYPGGA